MNIAGTQWLEDYKMELTEDYKKEVVGLMKSKRVFVFGDGGRRRSEGKYIIPTDINGQRRTLELDVIRADWYGLVWFGMVLLAGS